MSSSGEEDQRAKDLIVELCQLFYQLRWCTGSGGALSIRVGQRAFVTPSAVQKERIKQDELFELDLTSNQIIYTPPSFAPSSCVPLFLSVYKVRDAGAVFHTHSINAMLVTLICDDAFRISHQEMIKGFPGHQFRDTLEIPIINNMPKESLLEESLTEAVKAWPRSPAVLVRRHGVFLWADSWEQAKIQLECLDYLFEAFLKMRQLNIDPNAMLTEDAIRCANMCCN